MSHGKTILGNKSFVKNEKLRDGKKYFKIFFTWLTESLVQQLKAKCNFQILSYNLWIS